jgi:hypothetical protein
VYDKVFDWLMERPIVLSVAFTFLLLAGMVIALEGSMFLILYFIVRPLTGW